MERKGNTWELAKCPNCKKVARGKEQVMEKFGPRNNGGYLMVQSWCRECRNL